VSGTDMGRHTILVTNDDGIAAPGLRVLASALSDLGDLVIIAPEHNWSASGHSKTMHKPLRLTPAHLADGRPAMAASGSPSDCVALALLGAIEERPSLVISGINQGANVGYDLTYSGTVSAAMEAVIAGIGAIAVSLDSYDSQEFSPAAVFAAQLARRMLSERSARPLLLNVNVPALSAEEIRGVQITRLGKRVYQDELVHRADPRGRSYYWIGGDPPEGIPEKGTDIGALSEGQISITPVTLDLTDKEGMDTLRGWNLRF